jgi:hypothetical protein
MEFTFNTGRLYQNDGQIINVETTPDRIYFYDESRMIAGSFEAGNLSGEREVREAVMFCYDRGIYRNELCPRRGEARAEGA